MMVVIRIGDCFVTLLHVQEVELPKGSTYNCNMLKWHYPYMVEGVHGRRELLLNRMVEAMEGVLVCDTLTPFTTAKLGPLNTSGSQSIVSEDIIRTLQNSGKPWYLASVLHHNLLNSEYGSSLHIVHRIFPRMTYDEAAAVALFNKKLHDGTKEKASLVIQRNWKGKLAKMQATKKGNERQLQDRKVEEIRTFRMNPAVQARATLTALIITLTRPKCAAVPPLVAPVDDLIEALQKQGYTVEHLDNVPLPSLTKIVSQVDTDKCNFIFIVGYGGIMNLKQPPIFALQSLHLSLQEGAARAAIALESGKEYRRLMNVMKAEQADLKPAKKKKAAKATNVKKKKPDEIEAEQRQFESECRAALNAVEQGETFSRDAIQKEWENEVLLLSKTIRQSVVATRDFEAQFRPAEGKEPSCYLYPCECGRIEPYANHVLDVEDVIRAALHRQAPPIGLQSIIAFDLAPITPYAQGMSCIASSTGNTLRVVYKPQQKLLATNTITKAFNGLLPQVSATGKYAILSGGIETASNQRDWKSFASYYLTKLRDCCTTEQYRALREELDREVPFTAELIPVRQIILTDDVRERMKRDNDAQKVNVQMTFGVGNLKVQSDMFSVFRNILGDIPLSEITFVNQVNFLFTESNKGIDGIQLSQLEEEIEKLRPERCAVPISLRVTADGARLTFESQDSSDRLSITQWLNSIVVRSLTWQIESQPLEGYRRLDIDYTEYLYSIKTTCSLLRFTQLQKQQCKEPIPQPHIRFLDCELIKKGDK
ncbi:hypothetical protein, conserved [Angomonas deanei]|uniref:Uncharacterized protein n=1 Tax=Angomonas deanei TaxID=59799 RepID=A0A7G2CIK4_9TRYP|nr:hypothetical protein, conserved [Angomonas deanei]